MQVDTELLPPSHFTLVPPSSFSASQRVDNVRCTNAPAQRRGKPASLPPVGSTSAPAPGDRDSYARSSGVSLQPKVGLYTAQRAGRYYGADLAAQRSPRGRKAADDGAEINEGCRTKNVAVCGVQPGRREDLRRPSQPHTRSREDEKSLSAWLPSDAVSGASGGPKISTPAAQSPSHKTLHSSLPVEEKTAVVKKLNTKSSIRRKCTAGGGIGNGESARDNVEESLARSLAQCQKIDKSLEFYADIREKWRDGQHETPQISPGRCSAGRLAHSSACAKGINQTTPTAPTRAKQRPKESTSKLPLRGESDPHKASEPLKAAVRGGTPSLVRVDVGGRPQGRHAPRKHKHLGTTEKPPLNDLNSLQPDRKKKPAAVNPFPSQVQKGGPRIASGAVEVTKTAKAVANAPRVVGKDSKVEVDETEKGVAKVSSPARTRQPVRTTTHQQASSVPPKPCTQHKEPSASTQATCALPAKDSTETKPSVGDRGEKGQTEVYDSVQLNSTSEPIQDTEEEEFNDFDSVQSDSDSEAIEPLSGTFGKPVLTGAQPIIPLPHPVKSTLAVGHNYTSQVSSEEVVRKKKFTSTRNDTEIARILQAEEESRAGVSLRPNTSNDLAIARQIQQELNDLDEEGPHPHQTSAPTAAEGRGAPGAMTYKSNFEGMRFLSDDPTYYEQGYELGQEHVVHTHNCPIMEEKEKHRNLPRKSIKRNNYTGRWDDEYRYRGFDDRGYRNMGQERFQSHERKTWAIGGTGVITGCVRDLTRSEAILEREQQDLAFEGRLDLEEMDSGLDCKIITTISHEYIYKEKHRPKDESVKPVTQCAVCLDDFHVGEILRLLPCAHTFHRFCIDKWLEDNLDCPVCKTDIVSLARQMGVIVDRKKYKKRYW